MKNSTSEKKIALAREGEMWLPYKVQLLTQMLVVKAKMGYLFMHDDRTGEVHIAATAPDKEMYKKISQAAREFRRELRKAQK
jgi:hypothetical protein